MKRKILLSIVLIFLVLMIGCSYATEENNFIPREALREMPSNTDLARKELDYSLMVCEENAIVKDTAIDGNLFIVGSNVNVDNVIVYGDVYVAGQNITFNNTEVFGTGFIVGSSINMDKASFIGNIFTASKDMNFKGVVQDIFAAAEKISINEDTIITREMFATAMKIEINSADIGRNVNVSTDELTIAPNTNIAGSLNYSSKNEAVISSKSNIGAINFEKQEVEEKVEKESVVNKTAAMTIFYNILGAFVKSIVICGLIILFAKGFIKKQKVSNVVGYLGKNTLKGLLWIILIPIISIILLFTGLTVGISIALITLYVLVIWASMYIVVITIAANTNVDCEENAWRFYKRAVAISILIILLKQIPILGQLLSFIITLTGLGICITSLKRKKIVQENIIKE